MDNPSQEKGGPQPLDHRPETVLIFETASDEDAAHLSPAYKRLLADVLASTAKRNQVAATTPKKPGAARKHPRTRTHNRRQQPGPLAPPTVPPAVPVENGITDPGKDQASTSGPPLRREDKSMARRSTSADDSDAAAPATPSPDDTDSATTTAARDTQLTVFVRNVLGYYARKKAAMASAPSVVTNPTADDRPSQIHTQADEARETASSAASTNVKASSATDTNHVPSTAAGDKGDQPAASDVMHNSETSNLGSTPVAASLPMDSNLTSYLLNHVGSGWANYVARRLLYGTNNIPELSYDEWAQVISNHRIFANKHRQQLAHLDRMKAMQEQFSIKALLRHSLALQRLEQQLAESSDGTESDGSSAAESTMTGDESHQLHTCECGLTFNTGFLLLRHVKQCDQADLTQHRVYLCLSPKCNKTFPTIPRLRNHVCRVHTSIDAALVSSALHVSMADAPKKGRDFLAVPLVCLKQDTVVWAKYRSYPFWLGKVVDVQIGSRPSVTVHFFGDDTIEVVQTPQSKVRLFKTPMMQEFLEQGMNHTEHDLFMDAVAEAIEFYSKMNPEASGRNKGASASNGAGPNTSTADTVDGTPASQQTKTSDLSNAATSAEGAAQDDAVEVHQHHHQQEKLFQWEEWHVPYFAPGSIVWARPQGYPLWPGVVEEVRCDKKGRPVVELRFFGDAAVEVKRLTGPASFQPFIFPGVISTVVASYKNGRGGDLLLASVAAAIEEASHRLQGILSPARRREISPKANLPLLFGLNACAFGLFAPQLQQQNAHSAGEVDRNNGQEASKNVAPSSKSPAHDSQRDEEPSVLINMRRPEDAKPFVDAARAPDVALPMDDDRSSSPDSASSGKDDQGNAVSQVTMATYPLTSDHQHMRHRPRRASNENTTQFVFTQSPGKTSIKRRHQHASEACHAPDSAGTSARLKRQSGQLTPHGDAEQDMASAELSSEVKRRRGPRGRRVPALSSGSATAAMESDTMESDNRFEAHSPMPRLSMPHPHRKLDGRSSSRNQPMGDWTDSPSSAPHVSNGGWSRLASASGNETETAASEQQGVSAAEMELCDGATSADETAEVASSKPFRSFDITAHPSVPVQASIVEQEVELESLLRFVEWHERAKPTVLDEGAKDAGVVITRLTLETVKEAIARLLAKLAEVERKVVTATPVKPGSDALAVEQQEEEKEGQKLASSSSTAAPTTGVQSRAEASAALEQDITKRGYVSASRLTNYPLSNKLGDPVSKTAASLCFVGAGKKSILPLDGEEAYLTRSQRKERERENKAKEEETRVLNPIAKMFGELKDTPASRASASARASSSMASRRAKTPARSRPRKHVKPVKPVARRAGAGSKAKPKDRRSAPTKS